MSKNKILWGAVALALLAAGCSDEESPTAPLTESTLSAPALTSAARYVAAASQTIRWRDTSSGRAVAYLAQRALDAGFASELATSDWTTATAAEFADLRSGVTYHYRVKARDDRGRESDWSAPALTTRDTTSPRSRLDALAPEQTSLRLDLTWSATDEVGGVKAVEFWYEHEGGTTARVGSFDTSPISVELPFGGRFEFYTRAVDWAGNRESSAAAARRGTEVPDRITLTDATGKRWDVTNAVLRYSMVLNGWGHGLGPNVILPIIDPEMLSPGDINFPRDDEVFVVLGVENEGDARAYRLNDLFDTEVVDDVIGGEPLAVTY